MLRVTPAGLAARSSALARGCSSWGCTARVCTPRQEQRRSRSSVAALAPAASSGLLATLAAVWEVTQRVVLTATAVGAVGCAAASTSATGRRYLRAWQAEFKASPEGAQAFALLQYAVLVLVAKCFEFLTGTRGCLTLVYILIAALQLQQWMRNIPGPEEARARVEALEVGRPYVREPKTRATAPQEDNTQPPSSSAVRSAR